jgi:hypothetical protein
MPKRRNDLALDRASLPGHNALMCNLYSVPRRRE